MKTNYKDSNNWVFINWYNSNMKYIVFDFNGTILDDVQVGLKAENVCIKKFLKRPPMELDEYLHAFTFPVKSYYEKIGFNWNDGYTYEEVGDLWFKMYNEFKNEYKIFDGVQDILIKSHELGYKNILLSASYLVELKKQLEELKIDNYFDEVLGIDNIYAESKVHIGLDWIQDKNPNDCMFIGDSLHDLQVARAMKIENCVLVAKGHQAKDVLLKEYNNVVDDIREVKLCV